VRYAPCLAPPFCARNSKMNEDRPFPLGPFLALQGRLRLAIVAATIEGQRPTCGPRRYFSLTINPLL
jgi:hypothetical protein